MNLFSFRYFGQRSSSIFPSPLSILVILYALCEVNNLLPFASFTIVNSFIIPGTYTRNSPSYDRKYAQQKQDSICPHLLSLKTSSLKPFNPIVRKYNNILHILHATNDKTEEDTKKTDNLSDTYHDMDFDVSIIGAGPAGTIMATLLSEQYGLKVALIDPKLYDQWPNNYGVWLEEWKNLESIIGFSLINEDNLLSKTNFILFIGHFDLFVDLSKLDLGETSLHTKFSEKSRKCQICL